MEDLALIAATTVLRVKLVSLEVVTVSVVTPLIVMPHSKAWYIAKDSEVDGLGLVHSDARAHKLAPAQPME
jgi:hypothetical protein